MTEVRTWYTYATNILGYMNPKYKLVLGISRESTAKLLSESNRFLLCPKDTRRHNINKFKSIYQSLYCKKDQIVLPDNHYLIQTCGEIVYTIVIEPKDKNDINFLKALGPFSPWTIDYIIGYAQGREIYQESMKFGTIAIFILRIYRLKENILYYRESRQSVSNQHFIIEVDDYSIIENSIPIIPEEEFNEILNSIKYIISIYSALDKL